MRILVTQSALCDSRAQLIGGGLFTRDFLLEGIRSTQRWEAIGADQFSKIRNEAVSLFTKLTTIRNPSEAVTEKDLIYPLLSAVGWGDHVFVQPNASLKGRADVPDALLFADHAAHDLARKEGSDWKRFQHGLCVVEAKRWNRLLDREGRARPTEEGVPSTQMLRYLRRVDDVTAGRLRWGILTNGRVWRLYWQGALSVAEDFLEIDVGKALRLPGCELDLLDKRPDAFADNPAWRNHALRLFLLLFGRDAFVASRRGETFHGLALREGKFWEAQGRRSPFGHRSSTMSSRLLADALAKADPMRHGRPRAPTISIEVRQGALILLYRLLFVLYAEDRNLLPDESGPYAPYCLTKLRIEIADRSATRRPFPRASRLSGRGSLPFSAPSRLATTISAYRPTTAACSRKRPRRSSNASSFQTRSWRRSSSG